MNHIITPEMAGAFIKRGLEEDFIVLARESKDENFIAANMCISYLAAHYILCDENLKITPQEAYQKTLKIYPNLNETMVKTLVSQFSIRGDEFKDWVENPTKWETLWEIEKN